MLPSVAEERTRKMNKMKYGNKKKTHPTMFVIKPSSTVEFVHSNASH